MVIAIVAAILAACAVVAIIVGILILRDRKATPKAGTGRQIQQLKTVGVGSSPLGKAASSPSDTGDVVVGSDLPSVSTSPSDGLVGRMAVLAGASVAVFGALAAKLWTMQVLSTDDYANAAEQNLYTTVTTPAARGIIIDVNGVPLVKNKVTQTILAEGYVAEDRDTVRRLSTVLGLPVNVVRKRINDTSAGAQSQRVVANEARLRDISFIAEHSDAFRGVTVETRTMREYPYGALAAHVLGYTGYPSDSQLEVNLEGRTIDPNDVIGQAGIEAYYDNILAGDRGQRRVMVDASGNVLGIDSEVQPTQGCDIRLTIDSRVQYMADKLLAQTIAPNGTIGTNRGVAGSIVVMDVRDGSIVAMASYPTFDPTYFTGTIPTDIWELYQSDEAYAPLNNRSINGLYAAASTYKAFTSLAGLEMGYATKESTWECGGKWDGFGSGDIQRCWNHSGHGVLDLYSGIVNSCDVVFYEIAKEFYMHGPDGTGEVSATALQEQLAKFRFGEKTGIDLPSESEGRIPTPEWKAKHWRNVPSEAAWRGGDYTNMIIGQGDVLVTPLQIAVGYAAIATGRIIKPHLLKEVFNADGEVVVEYEPEVVATPDIKPEYLQYVRDALRGMVLANTKISNMFWQQGVEAAGKSGTAENGDKNDNAWFVSYAPYDDPHYVVACIIEQGGGGSDVAAPLVTQMMGEVLRAEAGTTETYPIKVSGSSGTSVPLSYRSASARDD